MCCRKHGVCDPGLVLSDTVCGEPARWIVRTHGTPCRASRFLCVPGKSCDLQDYFFTAVHGSLQPRGRTETLEENPLFLFCVRPRHASHHASASETYRESPADFDVVFVTSVSLVWGKRSTDPTESTSFCLRAWPTFWENIGCPALAYFVFAGVPFSSRTPCTTTNTTRYQQHHHADGKETVRGIDRCRWRWWATWAS